MREADPDFMLFFNGRSPLNTGFSAADTVSFPVLPRAHVKTTFSASLARSFPRVASPEAVFFPAAAIQLSARIALLRRAKARWILLGVPRLCVPNTEPGRLGAPGSAHWQSAPGGWGRSICKSAPTRIASVILVKRFQLSVRTLVIAPAPRAVLLFSPLSLPPAPAGTASAAADTPA